jgi:uncharacterized protein (UPF0179 family)
MMQIVQLQLIMFTVSDQKILHYIEENFFQVGFMISVLVVKCDVTCPDRKFCRNSGEK